MLSQIVFIALISYIIVQRVRVTRLSKQNMAKVLAEGGKLHSSNYVGFVKIFQSSWMLCMIGEVYLLDRPFIPALALFSLITTFLAQKLRYASIEALGDRWIHQVVTVPQTPVIDNGIYQYIRHPNWWAMITELAVVPLFHTAYLTSIVFSLLNAWLFSLNFGYAYSLKPERKEVLARNGKGQDSTSFVDDRSQTFVDPYSNQARQDYLILLEAILQRRPDGVLFDYIRYPRGTGVDSVADNVQDLWIFSPASRQALINRGLNNKGKFLIERYLTRGQISPHDIVEADRLYPQETAPLWQGRIPLEEEMKQSVKSRFDRLKLELWFLAVAHAAQGVIDYISYFERRTTNGVVEGINNKLKLIKRRGYGLRNFRNVWVRSMLSWHLVC